MLTPLILMATALAGGLEPGQPAPSFELPDTDGQTVKLQDFHGKTVIIEWFNPGCPYVKYAHEATGPLADMASKTVSDDTVWIAINSGAEGKQGAGPEVNKAAREEWALTHPVLLDMSGEVGKAYGATNTPQMVVVDAEGKVAYYGALDDSPMGKKADGEVKNFVNMALEDLRADRKVRVPKTAPYGCSVKYAS